MDTIKEYNKSSGGLDISTLVDNLDPVLPIRVRDGMGLAIAVTLFAGVGISLFLGIRSGLASGNVQLIYVLRIAALLMVGMTTAFAAMSMARPSVALTKTRDDVIWKGALAIAGLFPLTALVLLLCDLPQGEVAFGAVFAPRVGLECLTYSTASAFMVGTAIVSWLRRGAPTSLERAGWLVGIASGSFGAAAYSIYCPMSNPIYVGTWFTLAVGISAVAGRLIVPRFLRW